MFSQKKRRIKWVYGALTAVVITVCIFAVIAWFGRATDSNRAAQVNAEKETGQEAKKAQRPKKAEKTQVQQFYQSYYLVKYDKNVIRIFFSDETGKLTELEDTSIVFETLSGADQEDFRSGIRVNSREELNKLIMDYES